MPWTPVCLSDELPGQVVIPVTVAGEDLAVWRSESGVPGVFADRCPHRGMRLSHGFVRGEMLSCIYHGWRYDSVGRCRKIPAHPELVPPEAIRVPTWAVAEAGGVVWTAPADEDAGPPPALPDGLTALRSLHVAAPLPALDGLPHGLVVLTRDDPRGTMLHALLPAGCTPAQRLEASRALEGLRARAETGGQP